MKHFIDGDIIGFDTETTGLDVWHGDAPFAFSFYNMMGESAYFEFDVNPHTRRPIIGRRERALLEMMRALLEDRRIVKVMHNGKFDTRMMEKNYKIYIAGPNGYLKDGGLFHDTHIMAHNCNTLEPKLGLKPLTKKYCDFPDDDQDLLHKMTVKLRRVAKKLGWNISFEIKQKPTGEWQKKGQVAADYWLGRTMYNMGLLPEKYAGAERYCQIYAVKDAERTLLLYCLFKELMPELGVEGIYKLERELWPVIYAMETRGVRTDVPTLERQMEQAIADMKEIYPRLERAAWPGFKPKKDDDVRKLFYEKLGFDVIRETKGGKFGLNKKPAVDKFVLLSYLDNPVVKDIAVWKANYTAHAGFFSKFKRLSVEEKFVDSSGRMSIATSMTALHCDYRQIGAATGRLSAASPNLQNVMTPENTMAVHPIHVRPAFVPRPDMCWLCTDYEGMEINMYGSISQEPTMMKALREGRKIHEEMTNTIWGGDNNYEAIRQAIRVLSLDGTGIGTSKEVDELWKTWGVTARNVMSLTPARKEQLAYLWLKDHNFDQVKAQASIQKNNSKTTIKSLSFLKIYGGGAAKAALLLRVPVEEAAHTLSLYNQKFPRVDEYNRELISRAKKDGHIFSMWGRRLEIDPQFAYRAVNYMVQGSSADLMKRALVRIHKWLRTDGLDAYVLMTIHDEIVIELDKALLTYPFINRVAELMGDTEGHIPIQMKVESKVVTENWAVKRKIIMREAA